MDILSKNLVEHVGTEVTLYGWLNNKRSSGPIAFLELRDGAGFAQAVAAKASLTPEVWAQVEEANQESSVAVSGTVAKHPKREGVYELQVETVEKHLTCHPEPQ